jgi:hypothetical protein
LGEFASDKGGFVGRDVGGDDLAIAVRRFECDDGDDEGLELSTEDECQRTVLGTLKGGCLTLLLGPSFGPCPLAR